MQAWLKKYISGVRIGALILLHKPKRLIAATAGITVAVAIMFVELGFFFGVVDSQANIATLVRGELVILHRTQLHLNKWNELARIHLGQMAAWQEVENVVPLYKGAMGLENPDTEEVKRIIVYAFPPDQFPLNIGERKKIQDNIKFGGRMMFDRKSRSIYGNIKEGQLVHLQGRLFKVAGFVDIGPNIVNDGAVVMSVGSWRSISHNDQPIMGIVQLRQGFDVESVQKKIKELLPRDVTVMTPQQLQDREITFTIRAAPIGIIFGVGLLAGLVIGLITCYQVLFNEIADNVRQFATLRAMGFRNSYLGQIIQEQALILSVTGFIAGLAVSAGIYYYIAYQTALIMQFTLSRVLLIFAFTVLMCIGAGLLAMRRVRRSDPADLY